MAEETLRFGSGRDALRSEDEPLLTGRGRFTDDLASAGAAHAAFVRAPIGHGVIRAVDIAAAAKMPGVVAVFTGADLERDGIGAIPPAVLLAGTRRHADVRRVDAGARGRARALRRRAGRDRRRGDGGAGAGRRGGGGARPGRSARRVGRRARCRRRRTGDLGRRAGQRLPRLGRRRTRRRSTPRSRRRRTWCASGSSTPASRSPRWSRALRSVRGTPRPAATRSPPARRAWRSCGRCSPSRCSRCRCRRSAC